MGLCSKEPSDSFDEVTVIDMEPILSKPLAFIGQSTDPWLK